MLTETVSAFFENHPVVLAVLFSSGILASTVQDLKGATSNPTEAFTPLEHAYFWWLIGGLGLGGLAFYAKADVPSLLGVLAVGALYLLAITTIHLRNKDRWRH